METTNRNTTTLFPPSKKYSWMVHVTAWTLLFIVPYFFTGRETEHQFHYGKYVVVPLSFIIAFYINYFLLVDRYLFSKKPVRFVLSNLLLIAGLVAGVHLCMQLLPPPSHIRPKQEGETIFFFIRNGMMYILVAATSVAIKMTESWYRIESVQKELEKSKAEAELQNLKSQLNPHFLFNTLNNIYSLIAFSPERAQEAVHDLSHLLRYVLYESSQPFVTLDKEIDFINNYVELMYIRMPAHVELKKEISVPGNSDIRIAPLLFISLVENAFKHGISNYAESFIHIRIYQENEQVICHILNSYFPKSTGSDKSGSGVGLTNLKKRLTLLYPNKHILSTDLKDKQYVSLLRIDTHIDKS